MLQIASTMDDRGSVEAIRPVASPMDYLYLTFRTVQAAGAFRRRLKTRVQSSRAAANPHSYECKAEFASTAEKGIRRCLSRVEAEAAIGKHCAAEPSDRVSSGLLRETIATTSRPGDDDDVDDVAAVDSTTKPDCEVPTTRRVRSEKSVEPTHAKLRLETLAKAVQFGVSNRLSLAEAAADDIVFLQQRDDVICFKAWSLDQTLRKLFLVDTALRRLYLAECDQQTRSVPANYDLCNQKFIANLKHLLLRLRESLVQDAATKLYDPIKEEAVRDRQREQQRRKLELDTLFTEFKDNRRPLSTTWPWSIKPSLAVLWGVCWMFFNSPPQEQQTPFDDGNGFNNELYSGANFGLPPYQAPSQPTVDNSRLGLDPTQTTANLGSELEFAGDMSVLGTGRMPDAAPLRRTSALGPGFEFAQPRPGLRQQRTDQGRPGLGRSLLAHSQPQRQANSARESRVGVHEYGGETWVLEPKCNGSGIASSVPDSQRINAPALAATLSNFDFLPHQPGIRSEQPKSPPVWQQPRLGESYQVPSPATASGAPLGHSFQVPTSVTQGATLTAFEGVGGTSIEFGHDSRAHIGSHFPTTRPSGSLQLQHPTFPRRQYYSNGMISHQIPTVPIVQDQQTPPLQVPKTPVLFPPPSEPNMSPNEEKQLDDSNQPGSPRNRGHSYKREEDPPQNAQGKFLCAQCKNLLFDRRCEWNKHMDKHERPYHCSQKGCEKLQGFTYSGGLLRHEREVHKMHGTNKALFCKFPDCKRSSGVGFTRKENLQEHIRRVHRRPSQAGVDNGDVPSNDDAASPDAAAAVPERKPSPGAEKRKRHSYTGSYGHEDGGSDVDVREEMKRLRRENKALRDDMESFRREIGAIQGKIATLRGDDR